MKRKSILVLFLLVLSGIAGYLLSKASLVGRVGISLFYKQYKFLKVWWQGALLLFIVWMILFFLQGLVQRKLSPMASALIQVGAICAAFVGLYFTFQDFRHTTSHRWLGERFHLGGYLFWVGWIIISGFYLTEKRKPRLSADLFAGKNTSSVPGSNSI
jgi:hypothetical protein